MNDLSKNTITLKGKIVSQPQITHKVMDEDFYTFEIQIQRYNVDNVDVIPVVASVYTLKDNLLVDDFVEIKGEIRTYNVYEENHTRLYVRAFAKSIKKLDSQEYANQVELQGAIVKKPILRNTLSGKSICDICLGVNRKYFRSDYIPIIVWNKNAELVNTFNLYSYINVKGKLQSRTYQKKENDNILYERTVLEVSVNELNQITQDKEENNLS